MSEKYEPGQYVPIEEYQETIIGGPTPTGTASNTWPGPLEAAPSRCSCCGYCPTCGRRNGFQPYLAPWPDPYRNPILWW